MDPYRSAAVVELDPEPAAVAAPEPATDCEPVAPMALVARSLEVEPPLRPLNAWALAVFVACAGMFAVAFVRDFVRLFLGP